MGLFHVRRLATGTLLLFAALGGLASTALAQSGIISGRVTDAGSGAPIENAQVQATQTGGTSYGAITGSDGTFRVVNLPDGSYTVTVRVIGYDPRTFADQRPGANLTVTLVRRVTTLDQTVVTASRNRPEKALDAPAQISVVTSERIAERPAVTVTDHLRGIAGVDINRGGIAQANIVARGFNNAFSGSMLTLQDYRFAGVPSLRVNVPFLFTGTNEDIDRIEVLLGPASALYGPNSAAGVLHVITKSPFNSLGTTVSIDGGERSVIRAGLRHAGKISDKLAYKLSGEYMQGKDFEYNDRAEIATFPTTANVPADRRGQPNARDFDLQRYTGEARLDFRPNERSEAITTVGLTNIGSGLELTGANGTAQIKNWTYTSLQQRFRYDRLFAQVFMNISNAGNDTSTSSSGTFLLRSGQPIVDKSRVAAAQIQHGFDLGSMQSFTYGADYIWTNPQTGGTINGKNENDDNVTEYGAYIQSTTRPIKFLEILAAARVDANNIVEGGFFSPRAALIIKPTDNQNIRFTYNRAFSTPANFSYFLDLIQSPNVGGSGFDIRALGNPPKVGFRYNTTCGTGSQFGNFCMKSPFVGQGGYVPVSAANAFPGLIAATASRTTPAITGAITQGLTANGFSAAQAAALASTLAPGLVQRLGSLTPSATDLATRVVYLSNTGVNLTPEQLQPIDPLGASFNNTYEVGWKGIVGDRFRYDIAYWGQERGDVATTAALATPSVLFANPTQLGGYLGTQIGQYLGQQLAAVPGLTPAQINALASGLATALAGPTGLTPTLAAAPLGVVTFDDPSTAPNALYAVYRPINKKIWVRGLDLATDIVATDRLTFDLTYSYQSQNIWRDILLGGVPFMSNTPNSRGSIATRYRNEERGWSWELRTRYNEAYPVNSGVYATNTAYPIAPGQDGATTTSVASTNLGYNKCNPVAAGAFCYENVPEAFLFDAQIAKRFMVANKQLTWTISGTNVFDNRVRSFPGVPQIGRLVLTRLQYTF